MTNVKYVGRSDFRRVSKADFTGLEVEGDDVKAVEFKQGEVKDDLPESVVDVLLNANTFKGEFKELSDEEVEAEQNKLQKKAEKAEAAQTDDEGHASSGRASTTDAAGGGGGTTRGGGARKAAASRGSST